MDDKVIEYNFKSGHRFLLGFVFTFLLFFTMLFIFIEQHDEILHIILSIVRNRQIADIIMGISSLVMIIPIVKIGFIFSRYDVFAVLQGDHLVLKFKGEERVIKYSQIKNVFDVNLAIHIILKDGSKVVLYGSFGFSIRNMIKRVRFMSALRKELKNSPDKRKK